MKRLLSLLVSVFFVLSSFGQDNGTKPSLIKLQNFNISLAQNEWQVSKSEVVDGRLYRIVNDAEGIYLNREYPGFKVLEFLPKRAFIVSVDQNKIQQAQSFLDQAGASAVLRFRPEWKMSTAMFKQDIPDWAWVDNSHIKVNILYHKDLNHQNVINRLLAFGYVVVNEFANDNAVELVINVNQIEQLASLPMVSYLEEMAKPGEPENFTAGTNHRVNYLQASFPGSVHFDGKGVVIGHGDDGPVGEHLDYKGRIFGLVGTNGGDHGDHIVGTLIGAGNIDPDARGMAPGADNYYSDYPDNIANIDGDFVSQGVVITNSSYSNGCGAGYTVGGFTPGSRILDLDVMQNPAIMHVFSAGNSGTSTCGYGVSGTSGGVQGWGNITGGHKVAKNVMTVANLTRLDALANSSSRGPAEDGRIKPDISGVGTSVYSTTDIGGANSYTSKTGTSMSCPGVAGTMATLYEAYRTYNSGSNPESVLIKGTVLNTADDLGNPGPDFKHGYGRINARRAHEVLKNGDYLLDSISTGTNTHTISVPAGDIAEVRVMLIWADPPTFPGAGPDLINDLDLSLSQGSTSYSPWVLDPSASSAALNSNAVRARDSLNNMEQVTFTNPGSGDLSVDVFAFNIPSGTQRYYLIYEFVKDEIVITYPVGGEGFVAGASEIIRWDAPAGTGSFQLDYSTDNGVTWNLINANVNAVVRNRNWGAPNVATDVAKIRIIRGTDTAITAGTFVIAGEPTNFDFLSSCPDSLVLSWDPVPNISEYQVYAMGPLYMDSIGNTTDTFFVVKPNNPQSIDEWFSVAPVVNGKAGSRLYAIQKRAGIFNCQLSEDMLVSDLVSPLPGLIPNCFASNNLPVEIRIRNQGVNDVFNFTANYSFNGGPIISNTITDTVAPGQSMLYQFPGSSITLLQGSTYNIDVWINYTQDQNPYNDSISSQLGVFNSVSKTMPYSNNFENFGNCGINPNCGGTTCNLNDGWRNLTNGVNDDIDFRVDFGGTFSSGTGPSTDFNPGNSSGKYAYTEASGGCDSASAVLLSPCLVVDSTSITPVVEMAYHMRGGDMGVLRVDVISETGVTLNVIPQISGDQGTAWQVLQVNLVPWKGQTVVLRFTGKTGNGFESDIAIDDFNFFELGIAAPVASFTLNSQGNGCVSDTVEFTSTSTGNVGTYLWNFGNGATPSTANTAGPHKVVYAFGGSKQVSLEVGNLGGKTTDNNTFQIDDVPNASFVYGINFGQVNFTDGSSFSPTAWAWDFGDGSNSNLQNPSHTYTALGTYGVKLISTNDCGASNEYIDSVVIFSISLDEPLLGSLNLYPNPTEGRVNLYIPSGVEVTELLVTDLSGRLLKTIREPQGVEVLEIDLSDLPDGIYLIDINSDLGARSLKMVKRQ